MEFPLIAHLGEAERFGRVGGLALPARTAGSRAAIDACCSVAVSSCSICRTSRGLVLARSRALRNSATASAYSPRERRTTPRLLWAWHVGLEPEAGAVLGDRLVQLPLIVQGDAEVVRGPRRSRA